MFSTRLRFLLSILTLGWVLAIPSAQAANAIKNLQVRHEGSQLLLKLEMRDPIKVAPGNWSIVEPPRVVFDFPDTENLTGATSQAVASGDLRGLNLVQTEKLTRLVLNLYRSTKYSTEIDGNVMFIKLESLASPAGRTASTSTYQQATQAKAVAAAGQMPSSAVAAVRDVLFRRGEDGQAIVVVELSDGTVPVDVRRTGSSLSVELADVEVPDRLQNRRDVTDFATPVTSVVTRSVNGATRIEVAARGKWFHQAQLANNQLTIEVKPIPADDANKLVQTGQQGQKVSINFFDADATMILRTLADISGKNVMIDPSLSGRRITVALDNIPYDQALDIVMGQVNAGMRIRNDVLLFGDRAVLQQRDQAAADEASRANDTAPVVAETFTLSYIKPSELAGLIRANITQSGNGGAAAQPAAGQAPGAPAAGARQPTGMLSARGSMSPHDLTKKLFVRDTESVIEAIRDIVRNVDVPQKQVMIEARIVEAGTNFTHSFGMRLRGFSADTLANSGAQIPGTRYRWAPGVTNGFTNVDTFGTPATPALARSSTQVFGPSYQLAGAANLGLMLFNRAGTNLLALELQAAETDQKNKTVSSPRIVTMDRKAATINNTQQVTILTGVNAQTGLPIYQTFAAPLNLTVTPSINPDNRISLDLNIAKSTITNVNTGSLDTNTVTTSVIVENGGTVVIGGFSRESENQGQDRVPFLGDLPYVGFLFKTTNKVMAKSELLVFITPRIVSDAIAAK